MIKISKREAFYMRNMGFEEFVKKSFSKSPTYFLVEETEDVYKWNKYLKQKELVRLSAMNVLKLYRQSHIIYSSDSKK